MTTASAIADAGRQRDQGQEHHETPACDDTKPCGQDWTADHNGPPTVASDTETDRSLGMSAVRSWPVLVLAMPAAVAVWSGWVGIGQMTGFGEMRPLPGIWNSLHMDTAVTLPIGVEAYAAFALRVWLTSNLAVSDRTRGFARCSAIAALILGMAGQVAYHLLAQARVTRAPWEVTTIVACLPVLVLGMGSAVAHMLRGDAATANAADTNAVDSPVTCISGQKRIGRHISNDSSGPGSYAGDARVPARARIPDAHAAAMNLIASGQHISRRSLRSAGMQGSNADLGMLARLIRASLPTGENKRERLE